MFGIGIPELIVIMVIALIVIGPEKLPDIAKTLGKALSEFKNVVDGVKTTMEEEQRNIEKGLDEKPAQAYSMSLEDKEEELKKDYEDALNDEESKLKTAVKTKESSPDTPKPKKARKTKVKETTVKEA